MTNWRGIYIARFPTSEDNGVEYRVIHSLDSGMTYDKIEDEDLECYYAKIFLLYHKAVPFDNVEDARKLAFSIEKNARLNTEYGINSIYFDKPLADLTVEKAESIMDDWHKKLADEYKKLRYYECR